MKKRADLIVMLLGVGFVIALLWHSSVSKSPVQVVSPEQKKFDERKNLAFFIGTRIVDGDRDPARVRFRLAYLMADGTDCYDWFGENGFGGLSEARLVETQKRGYEWQEVSGGVPGFAREWNAHCANKKPVADETADLNEYVREKR